MSKWDDEPKTPLWVWCVIYALILGVIGAATGGAGTIGDGPHDDGCSSMVSPHQGCFP